ncbi:lipopolysaccharide biosynthesis protein [Croceicoccus sp. F390]|uniref:Lipopolysaccharide biosynthesis protein n=1 Tax=Croceicoccus esteveae TaxID=3075597 RepID=A0ABU2ZK68_9SPHN|nr:lipopolysaccharide biosynthesis protein [Croceicoccus sp. F390]MDT0576995.1 lipopolysaccharide biosynthesis protein [Croceicoccus sp. F390]
MSSILGRMVSGSLWLSGARAITNALGFVSTIVLARLLLPADFGLVALGATVLAIITAVTEMSLSQALVHHPDPREDHFHTAWTLSAARGLLLALLMCVAARPLVWIYDEPRLELVIYAFAASVLIGGLGNPRQIMLTKELIFWQQFMLNVVGRLATVFTSIMVAIVWQSYWALIAGVIAGQVITTVLTYFVLPFRPRLGLKHAGELWSFSVWLTLGQAINTINWRFDQLLVGNILGKAALGFYSVGDNLAQMPTREATAPLTGTLFPALARIAHDPDRLRHAYHRAQALITFVALPVGIGFALVAKPLVLVAMGEKWLPAVPVIQALSAVFALITLGSMVQPLAMAKGHTKQLFRRDLQMFCIRLPIIIGGTVLFGLPGLIYSRVITGLLAAAVNMWLVRQLIRLSITDQVLANGRSLIAGAAMAAAVLWLQHALDTPAASVGWDQILAIAASVATGAVVYPGVAFGLWFMRGRPAGPESEALKIPAMIRGRRGDPEIGQKA